MQVDRLAVSTAAAVSGLAVHTLGAVHTGWSFDAFTNGSRTTPTDAYAWAQGREITNSGFGGMIQILTPRRSTIDAARLGVAAPKGLPASIQERAWS